jgi:hypothetical protein
MGLFLIIGTIETGAALLQTVPPGGHHCSEKNTRGSVVRCGWSIQYCTDHMQNKNEMFFIY